MTNNELLTAALRGTGTDWETVHEVCGDRARAEDLGKMLEASATVGNDAAEAWAHVLEEMHPGLKVNLPAAPPL